MIVCLFKVGPEGDLNSVSQCEVPDSYSQSQIMNMFGNLFSNSGTYIIAKMEKMYEYKVSAKVEASFVHKNGEKLPQ